ncbi:GNAT family N-acetyltransferase [Alteribacter natronophilus]|uniref:GNAT family N-acetyltransferase n=1 Tax=Alteribacter natronophilus TaxID=2583810 RepID=UPI00110D3762|nr:GNAT family N-acetyltransferase [Alteribacter natronophilus]TMW70099.1 GNAT family N-acetyltransferase [Alteribacter natronophilus]
MMTRRLTRLIEWSERQAREAGRPIQPGDLLSGALCERTGVFAELYLTFPDLAARIRRGEGGSEAESGVMIEEVSIPVSTGTAAVFTRARQLRNRYGQDVLNEGHVMRAVMESEDERLGACLSHEDRQRILSITSAPRDMIVPLTGNAFSPPSQVKRAGQSDREQVRSFVGTEFGSGWLEAVDHAFNQTPVTLFTVMQEGDIIGFAAYDADRKQKGVLGPMGVASGERSCGAGTRLLSACLDDMQKAGYRYAVISEAGPVEFYEKTCGASVIVGDGLYTEKDTQLYKQGEET